MEKGYHSWSLGTGSDDYGEDLAGTYGWDYTWPIWMQLVDRYEEWDQGGSEPVGVSYEAEDLPYTNYDGQVYVDTIWDASGGECVRYQSYADGSWLEYTVSNLTPGTYDVDMQVRLHNWGAGIYQTTINGQDIGSPIDYYGTGYATYGFSSIPVGSNGTMTIRFTCTGMNPSAFSRRILPDVFTLTRQASAIELECEDLSYTHNGNWVSLTSSSGASGGEYLRFECSGAGRWIEFTTPTLNAGAYNLTFTAREHEYNGIYQMQVNGTDVGPSIDYFNGSFDFMDFDFGTISLATGGPAQIRFLCEGKVASALAYRIMPDLISLTPLTGLPVSTVASDAYFAEFEGLSYAYNRGSVTAYNTSYASGGTYLRYQGYAVGDWVEFTLPAVEAGDYVLDLQALFHQYAGIYQLSVNGMTIGNPVDYYYPGGNYQMVQFRDISLASSGTVTLRFTCTGINAAAMSRRFHPDALSLREVFLEEAESQSIATSSATSSVVADSAAYGGNYLNVDAASAGAAVTLTLPTLETGTYSIGLDTIPTTASGIYQVEVNGVAIGEPVDFSQGTSAYLLAGAFSQTQSGPVEVRLLCTGKSGSSTNYDLKLDRLQILP